jgi:hypothetical protein
VLSREDRPDIRDEFPVSIDSYSSHGSQDLHKPGHYQIQTGGTVISHKKAGITPDGKQLGLHQGFFYGQESGF